MERIGIPVYACVSRPLSNEMTTLMSTIVKAYGADKKITCIKILRAITGLGLKEAKDVVEQYIREYF